MQTVAVNQACITMSNTVFGYRQTGCVRGAIGDVTGAVVAKSILQH